MRYRYFLDLIFPPRCPVCDRPIVYGKEISGFCPECIGRLPVISGARCYKCGRKLCDCESEFCSDCEKNRATHIYDKGMALCTYDDVMRRSVYFLKYGKRAEYAFVYGRLMGEAFGKMLRRAGVDSVIAVPLHNNRAYKRGYNQAQLLAKSFSEASEIPFYKDFIIRTKDTVALKSLTRSQRQKNLEKAFKLGRNDVKLNITVVIDDIYTTGSTIDAVSKVLRASGVRKIYFLTLAIGEDS